MGRKQNCYSCKQNIGCVSGPVISQDINEKGDRPVGRPKLRFKDVLKRDLVDFQIPTRSWPQLASNRFGWRSMLHEGMRHDHQQTDNKMRRDRCL